jgi:hypothetical protein
MSSARTNDRKAMRLRRIAPIGAVIAATVFAPSWHAHADSTDGTGTDPAASATLSPDQPTDVTAPVDPTVPTDPSAPTDPTVPPPSTTRLHVPAWMLSRGDAQSTNNDPSQTSSSQQPAAKSSTGPLANPNPSAAPCPLPPPQHHDNEDMGFFTIKEQAKPGNQFLLTLTFRCYDLNETQNAKVNFVGVVPTGAGTAVKVLSGDTAFSFIGHQSTAIVDAKQDYLLDPTVLGDPAKDGWHIKVDVPIMPDNSASRSALVVLGTHPALPPSVLPFHARIPHKTLPTTGSSLVKVYAVGIEVIVFGLYFWYIGGLPVYRPKHR